MKTKLATHIVLLFILFFVLLFASKNIFEYNVVQKYSGITMPSSQSDDLSSLIIDVINSSINVTIVLISIFLAVFLFVLSILMGQLDRTLNNSENRLDLGEKSIEKLIRHFSITSIKNKKQNDLMVADFNEQNKSLIANFNQQIETIGKLEVVIKSYAQYAERSNSYIYEAITQMAALIEPNRGKALMEKITTDLQRLHLFSEKKEDRMAALYYLGEKGTKDHLDELREVATNDLDEDIRQLAAKVIGRIEERERNS
jgi:hypothetical protein